MALANESNALVLIHHGLVRLYPHLVERIYRHVCRAIHVIRLLINLLPERLAGLILRVHQAGGDLLKDIVLAQQVAAHLGRAESIGNNAVLLIGRKVDPQVFFGSCDRGKEIPDELGGFILERITLQTALARINEEIEFERISRIDLDPAQDRRIERLA